MICQACESRRRFMSADPEMYRGEDMRCNSCMEIATLRERVKTAEAYAPGQRSVDFFARSSNAFVEPTASEREPGKIHVLKTWPAYFQAIVDNRKTFEIRDCSEDDRDFMEGDILQLEEWNPVLKEHTGRNMRCRVTYIFRGGLWGIPENMCVMSIAKEEVK